MNFQKNLKIDMTKKKILSAEKHAKHARRRILHFYGKKKRAKINRKA